MSKVNALDQFVRTAPTPPTHQPPATVPAPAPPALSSSLAPARRQASQALQMIPYRVSQDDHRALKVLAAHDGTSLQAMIDAAVRAYVAQRGVKLS